MSKEVENSKAPIVLGIVNLVTWLIPIIGVIFSIVGIVKSVKSLKENKIKIYKIALALNIIGLIASLTYWAIGIYKVLNV